MNSLKPSAVEKAQEETSSANEEVPEEEAMEVDTTQEPNISESPVAQDDPTEEANEGKQFNS